MIVFDIVYEVVRFIVHNQKDPTNVLVGILLRLVDLHDLKYVPLVVDCGNQLLKV